MDAPERVDRSLDRLLRARAEEGCAPIPPAGDVEEVLTEIAGEIAPLGLPAEIARFWRRVQPHFITDAPFIEPAYALDLWRRHRDDFPGMTPNILFPVCYASHWFLLVELHDEHGLGGALFTWDYGGGAWFRLLFHSLPDFLDELADRTEHRVRSRRALAGGAAQSAAQAPYDGPHSPHPRYGDQRSFSYDVRLWPSHWHASSGLSEEDRRP